MGSIITKKKIYPIDKIDSILTTPTILCDNIVIQPKTFTNNSDLENILTNQYIINTTDTYTENIKIYKFKKVYSINNLNNDNINNILNNKPIINNYPSDNCILNYLDNCFIRTNNIDFMKSDIKSIIIILDFIDSTKIMLNNIINFINVNKQFNKDILTLLNIYQNIYIYEIIGDSYILTINFPNIDSILYPASLAIIFCINLINITKKYINIRIGISYDYLYYGIINNHIRIFGNGICLAARLEQKALKNKIVCCKEFYNQLIMEDKLNLIFEKENIYLKSFGNYECYILNLNI